MSLSKSSSGFPAGQGLGSAASTRLTFPSDANEGPPNPSATSPHHPSGSGDLTGTSTSGPDLCRGCGAPRSGGAPFCPGCGQRFPEKLASPRARFCSNCGQETHPGGRFCGNCGAPTPLA
jgi:hypothetical protein